MKYKIGEILEVVNRGRCPSFKGNESSKYIKVTGISSRSYYYDILDKSLEKVDSCSHCLGDEDLKTMIQYWDNLSTGDIVLDDSGFERKVLAVIDDLFALSDRDNFDIHYGWYTKKEAQDRGFTVKPTVEEEVEMTQEQIEKQIGKKIKIVASNK